MNKFILKEIVTPPIQLPSPPPPSAPSTYQYILQNKLSPSIILIIIVLSIICFISALLHFLVRFLLKPSSRNLDDSDLNSVTAMQGQLQQLFHLHDCGVDQSFIDALPVFHYKTIVGLKDPFDCAVCLCEFEGDDKLRLLPKCSHAFHIDCIDTWLLSHSTCPLCRRNILPDFSPNNSRRATVFILESESDHSSREIASARVETGSISNLGSLLENDSKPCGNEIFQKPEENCKKEETKVVTVKLGKFKCVESEAREGEGTSSGSKENKGNMSNRRRCFSMGSYEYVMDENTSLRVTIKPPKKKPVLKKPNRRRLAMSECDCYSRRDGFKSILESSRLSCAKAESAVRSNMTSINGCIQKKDSFSVSKIWMVQKKADDRSKLISDDLKRRSMSFQLPVHRQGDGTSPVKLSRNHVLGLDNKSIGSEIDWDLEDGSFRSSVAPSIVEETPSFARRTLLWVVARQNKSRSGSLGPS